MTLSTIIWTLVGTLALLGGGAITGKKTFHVETMIPAPPEMIWKVLMDQANYEKWNTVLIPKDGELKEGATISYEMRDDKGETSLIKIKVAKLEPNKELNQKGGIPGILSFNHRYILEPVNNGTKLIQHEIDQGLGMWFWDSSWIEPAYKKSADGIKALLQQKYNQ